jgi:hypothetical protein
MADKHRWSDPILARAAAGSPLTVMAQLALEHLLTEGPLDALFERARDGQYTRTLTFSAVVDLMAGVVLCFHASVRKAWQARRETLGVTLQAVYDKLAGFSPALCTELVAHMAHRAAALITHAHGERPPPLPGWTVRMLDGNHLAATERRLAPLRGSSAGPRPGLGLVVYDPAFDLPIALLPAEDAYTQERALLGAVLKLVARGECWIADRNFCVTSFLVGLIARGASFIIRQHANLLATPVGPRVAIGRAEGATVYEEPVVIATDDTAGLALRRIVVVLDTPGRHGDREIAILTDLPPTVDALTIAAQYRTRWQIETAFLRLATLLRSEIAPLAYPRAALFGFAVALVAYMVLAVVQAALRAEQGPTLDEQLSVHAVVEEVSKTHRGMMMMVPTETWEAYRRLEGRRLAAILVMLASQVDMVPLKKARRGPKKPPTPRTRFTNRPHVSTRRVLDGTQQDDS